MLVRKEALNLKSEVFVRKRIFAKSADCGETTGIAGGMIV